MQEYEMKLDMFGIVSGKLEEMKAFYQSVMEMEVLFEEPGSYVEFKLEGGLRLAITSPKVMTDITDHSSFAQKPTGQRFELAFKVHSPAEVDNRYAQVVQKGARAIREARNMPWGHRAAFFADPDGNIHEIFAELA